MSADRPAKRMRVFAGPNGSGKSTLVNEIKKVVRTGTYINADEIEHVCRVTKFINLGSYNVTASSEMFLEFLGTSTLYAKATSDGYKIDLNLTDNVITVGDYTNSYEAALIAEFLRLLIIAKGDIFTFETVMSHPGKLETFNKSKEAGYKNYLYFVSTESVEINARRIEERVAKGGHPVNIDKIRERYYRSMELVSKMIPYCYRCFLFDNSQEGNARLILEIFEGSKILIQTDDEIPAWVDFYVLEKFGV